MSTACLPCIWSLLSHVPILSLQTTALIWPSKFTIPVIPSNQDQAISWLPENVDFLAFAMKHYPPSDLETMGWGRWMRTSMQTIAQGKIKIMPWYTIWLGESCVACTRTSLCHSWLSGTLSSHLIGVWLVETTLQEDKGGVTCRHCTSSQRVRWSEHTSAMWDWRWQHYRPNLWLEGMVGNKVQDHPADEAVPPF